jgi:hypothetical protein
VTAGLAHVPTLYARRRTGYGFAEGYLWHAHVDRHRELARQPLEEDLNVRFAHARDDLLASGRLTVHP